MLLPKRKREEEGEEEEENKEEEEERETEAVTEGRAPQQLESYDVTHYLRYAVLTLNTTRIRWF